MSTPAVEEFLKEQAVIMFRLEHERLKKEGFAVAYTFIELSSDETLGLEEVTPLAEGTGKKFLNINHPRKERLQNNPIRPQKNRCKLQHRKS